MKRTDLIRHLSAHGCKLLREGGRHSIYWNPANRFTTAVPRYAEIVDPVAKSHMQGPRDPASGRVGPVGNAGRLRQ